MLTNITSAQLIEEDSYVSERLTTRFPSLLSVLRNIFGERKRSVKISQAAIIRILPSGDVLTLRVHPTSRNTSSLECNLYQTSVRHHINVTAVEEVKAGILAEVEHIKQMQRKVLLEDYSHRTFTHPKNCSKAT